MKNKAFTLAETLITLSILGVVAAMTIPNIVHKVQDIITIVKLKQTYSMLNRAYDMAIIENGPIQTWNWSTGTNTGNNIDYFAQILSNYLHVKKLCVGTNKGNCFYTSSKNNLNKLDFLNGTPRLGGLEGMNGKMILKNGVCVSVSSVKHAFNTQNATWGDGEIIVDLNCGKKPNRLGYDTFTFYLIRKKAQGLIDKRLNVYNGDSPDCTSPDGTGWHCSTWIINHNSMDYKYRDVSAEW